MGIKHLKVFLVGIIVALFSFPASAQTLEIGLFGGGSYYIGEMNPTIPFKNTQLAYGAVARFNANRRWAVRLSYQRGGIKGVDTEVGRVVPANYSFETTVNDIAAVAEFNFLEYFTGSNKNFFTPYIFGGLGYFIADNQSNSVTIPFGLGVKYSVAKRIALGLEWGMRKTFTDDLDGVNSLQYQTGVDVGSDDNSTWDWYSFAGLTITYKINLRNKLKCNLEGW